MDAFPGVSDQWVLAASASIVFACSKWNDFHVQQSSFLDARAYPGQSLR